MEVLGQIIGIAILIFGVVMCIVAFCYGCNYDLDGPIFKTDIKITIKEEVDEDEEKH